MPRFARVVVPECAHHVTQRGNARRDVFYTPADRTVYLGLLKEYSEHYGLRILGYCLMTNHVHLVAVPTSDDALAKTMRETHGRYARYRNAIDTSSGHVWQNRFYSCAVEETALASVMRYVELNPVRAQITPTASEYNWSSAAAHLGQSDSTELLSTADWSAGWTPDEWAHILRQAEERSHAEQADAIRDATYSGRPLGSPTFIGRLEIHTGRRLTRGQPGRRRLHPQLSATHN